MVESVSTSSSESQVPTLIGTNAAPILINHSHPFFISPSDSPGMFLVNTAFDGKSFGRWKRGMLIALTAKNKLGFIDGPTQEPVAGFTDISTHYTKMKCLWDELNTLNFYIPRNCAYSCGAKEKSIKSKQDEGLVQFLMGLNDSYCAPRGNILMISPLPSTPKAYALLMQEERQREVQNTPKFPVESSSFIAASQGNNGQR
ncbi:hypothetical protein KY290_025068 [Solanum tuberosum]|uniref:Retrotransposon Copia-like N-terminal domain-containing protein n=1 Tax=Solanum tuberosum TaxID=4113 RepID=A0ABQ7UTN7_SOLTU|nr:hypothetical protein KY290_025068 [Solanum tuberosum]